MISKIKKNLFFLTALMLLSMIGFTGVVSAQEGPNPQASICRGADKLQVSSSTASDAECNNLEEGSTDKVNQLITQVINIFSVVVGIIAVIMIIYGGLKYITSGGDSGNVTGAKNTILYAIIGLIIVALAQFIVRFVLAKTSETANG